MFKTPILLLALLLNACVSTNSATGARVLNLTSDTELQKIGEQTIQSHLKNYGLYKELPQLETYYQQLAKHIYGVTELRAQPAEFLMFDDDSINAFATPGHVAVFRGLLPYLNSEAELAAVLAHEAGHLTAEHITRGVSSSKVATGLLAVGSIATAILVDDPNISRAAGVIGSGAAVLALSSFSREYEREADALAVRYMAQAGYDPREAWRVFKSFDYTSAFDAKVYRLLHNGKQPEKAPFYDLLRSHPEPQERQTFVAQTVGLPDGGVQLPAGITPATPAADPQGRARYFQHIDGLHIGPKVENGIAGKDFFYDPYDRFEWRLPTGMFITFAGNHWEGINPADGSRLFLGGLVVPEDASALDAEEALRQLFPSARGVERLSAGGRTGYTGTFQVSPGDLRNPDASGRARVVVLHSGRTNAQDFKGKRFLVFTFLTPHTTSDALTVVDQNIRQAMDQFQYVSPSRAKQFQPLRLKIHTVQAGDTLASLAARMAAGALQQDWFLALNALTVDDPLIPGMQVKLVIDPNQP